MQSLIWRWPNSGFYLRQIHVLNIVKESSADPLNSTAIQGRKEDASRLFTGSRALLKIILFLLSWKRLFERMAIDTDKSFSVQNYGNLCNGESKGSFDLELGTLKWTLENKLSAIFKESSKNSLSGKREVRP